jgi:hypothetical protein
VAHVLMTLLDDVADQRVGHAKPHACCAI